MHKIIRDLKNQALQHTQTAERYNKAAAQLEEANNIKDSGVEVHVKTYLIDDPDPDNKQFIRAKAQIPVAPLKPEALKPAAPVKANQDLSRMRKDKLRKIEGKNLTQRIRNFLKIVPKGRPETIAKYLDVDPKKVLRALQQSGSFVSAGGTSWKLNN